MNKEHLDEVIGKTNGGWKKGSQLAPLQSSEKSSHIHNQHTPSKDHVRTPSPGDFSSAFIQPGDCLVLTSGHRIRHAAMKPSWFPVSVVAVMYQQKAVQKKREAKGRGGEKKHRGQEQGQEKEQGGQ